jgi:hypothetical protein
MSAALKQQRLLTVLLLLLMSCASVFAANDPGHDSLYILKIGNSSVVGSINISDQLNATLIRFTNRAFGDYLDINANGTILGAPSQPRIMAGSNVLHIDSTGNLYLNTKGGTTGVVQVGDTATNGVTMNVSGQLVAYNLTIQNGYSTGGFNVTGSIFAGGAQVCTTANGLCAAGGASSSAGGWVNDSTSTRTTLQTIVNSSNISGSFIVQNQTGSTHLFINGTTGHVGIRNSSPNAALVVRGSGTNIAEWYMSDGTAAGSINLVGTIYSVSGIANILTSTNAYVQTATTGTTISRNQGDTNVALIVQQLHASSTGDVLQVKNNANTHLVVGQAGSVGINTTTPGSTLEVKGSFNASSIAVGTTSVCLSDGTNCPSSAGSGWINTTTTVYLANNATNVTVDNGVLFIDTTNNRVGIRTTAPAYELSVNGTTNLSSTTYVGGTLNTLSTIAATGDIIPGTGSQIDFFDETGDKIYYYANNYGTGIESSTLTTWSQGRHRWRMGGTTTSDGTQIMSVTSTGLAIGTGDPSVALDVTGAGAFSLGVTIGRNLTFSTAGAAIHFPSATGVKAYYYGTNYGVGIEPNTLTTWSQDRFRWRFGSTYESDGTEYLTLTTTGLAVGGGDAAYRLDVNGTARTQSNAYLATNGTSKVGVNTTSPTATLTVAGSFNATGGIYQNNVAVCLADGTNCPGSSSAAGWLNTTVRTYTQLQALVNSSNISGSFIVQNQTGSPHLFVNGSSGSIGIGTAGPNSTWKLDVNTSSSLLGMRVYGSGYEYYGSSYYGEIQYGEGAGATYYGRVGYHYSQGMTYIDAVNGAVALRTGSAGTTTALYAGLTGNVGIGTIGPTAALTINSSNVAGSLLVQNSTGNMHLLVNGSSGQVRIGNAEVPDGDEKLHVSNDRPNSATIEGRVSATSGANYAIVGTASGSGATTNTALYGWASGAATNYGLFVDSGDVIVGTGTLWVNNSGLKVGINTTTPTATLTVRGSFNATGPIYQNNVAVCLADGTNCPSTTSAGGWVNDSTTTRTTRQVFINSSSALGSFHVLNQTGSSHLFVNGSTGFIGIGNASPSNQLQIEGTADTGSGSLLISRVGNQPNVIFRYDGNFVSQLRAFTGRLSITTSNGGQELFTVNTTSGNVGIGTNAPNKTLQVNGSIANILHPGMALESIANISTGMAPRGYALRGRYLYVVNRDSSNFAIIDMSNPSSPTQVGNVSVGTSPRAVEVVENYAFVLNTWPSDTISVIDISNPGRPVVVGNISHTTAPEIVMAGRYLYAAGGNFHVFDLSNPVNITDVANASLGYSGTLAVQGQYVYIADWANGLVIVNVSNPQAPKVAGTLALGGDKDWVFVQGKYAYVLAATANVMHIVDVSNVSAPRRIGNVSTAEYPIEIDGGGRYLYVTTYFGNKTQVFDLADPTTPLC